MGDISQNFDRSEFKCRCCGLDTVDAELIEILESIRAHFGKPVKVTSGCRCEAYNKSVGGKKRSQHLLGRAADIQIKDTSPINVYEYAEYLMSDRGGLGNYNTFTHIDTRTGKARWSAK